MRRVIHKVFAYITTHQHLLVFFWVPLPHGVPPLIADHGIMLSRLVQTLASESM